MSDNPNYDSDCVEIVAEDKYEPEIIHIDSCEDDETANGTRGYFSSNSDGSQDSSSDDSSSSSEKDQSPVSTALPALPQSRAFPQSSVSRIRRNELVHDGYEIPQHGYNQETESENVSQGVPPLDPSIFKVKLLYDDLPRAWEMENGYYMHVKSGIRVYQSECMPRVLQLIRPHSRGPPLILETAVKQATKEYNAWIEKNSPCKIVRRPRFKALTQEQLPSGWTKKDNKFLHNLSGIIVHKARIMPRVLELISSQGLCVIDALKQAQNEDKLKLEKFQMDLKSKDPWQNS